jgi:hypothetical protein
MRRFNGLRFEMSANDQPERTADDGVSDAKMATRPACVALVPVSEPARYARPLGRLSLPDPIFLTHLIATVEQVPQTRQLRRAAQADALSAYRAHRSRVPEAGFRTQQVV